MMQSRYPRTKAEADFISEMRALAERTVAGTVNLDPSLDPVVLGPAPCIGCRDLVWYRGRTWRDADGSAHKCPAPRRP